MVNRGRDVTALRSCIGEKNKTSSRDHKTWSVQHLMVALVFIGAEANTGWLEGAVELDERSFVLTGAALDRYVREGEYVARTFAGAVPS